MGNPVPESEGILDLLAYKLAFRLDAGIINPELYSADIAQFAAFQQLKEVYLVVESGWAPNMNSCTQNFQRQLEELSLIKQMSVFVRLMVDIY
jgi:hypothetical protein